jgi:lysophospholipase L1-like esterase
MASSLPSDHFSKPNTVRNKERSRNALMGELAALFVAACSVAMGLLAGVSWLGLFGQVLLTIAMLGRPLLQGGNFAAAFSWSGVLGAVCSAWVPVGFILAREISYPSVENYWRHFSAMLAWWILVAVLACSQYTSVPAKSKWVLPPLGGALLCGLVWVASSYCGNSAISFYLGLTTLLALLVLCELWLKLPWVLREGLHTAILLIVLLPVANVLFNRVSTRATPATSSEGIRTNSWTYSAARHDPPGFDRWWARYSAECQQMFAALVVLDPETKRPSHLRPDSHAVLGECQISVNHRGFRGPEIPDAKGDAYRIVAMGESSTFGHTTLTNNDKPWPELLEKLIRERLKPGRQVQVINAGVPAIDLSENLRRLPTEILPLKPDMLISYHGVNGFHLLSTGIPVTSGKPPPNYCERPARLLAECEYRVKMAWYRKELTSTASDAGPPVDLQKTRYAECYRQLIHFARTNGIHLVMANFSMAVNPANAPDEVQFFRVLSPGTIAYMRGNVLHSELVRELGVQNPEVRIVDTHPGVDGNPEMFIDLMHLGPEGEQQVAENFFVGIRDILEKDVASSGKPR